MQRRRREVAGASASGSSGKGGTTGRGGASSGASAGETDAGFGGEAGSPAGSGGSAGEAGSPGDGGAPSEVDAHIHIFIENDCSMSVSPTEISIPAGRKAYFDWHNHSVDYPVTVWMSYGGGYVDLPTGSTWDEPIAHCSSGPYIEYADISTACSEFSFAIHCL